MLHGFEQDEELKALKRSQRKRWPGIVFKIFLGLGFLFCAGLVVLSKIGGSGEPLRVSVEQFFHDNTQFEAQLTKLNSMEFFPATIVDVEGLSLYISGESDGPAVTVEKARIEAGFWDIALSTGNLRFMAFENIGFKAGRVVPNPVQLSFLKLMDVDATHGRLAAEWRIGAHELSAAADVGISGEGFKKKYKIGEERRIEIALSDLKFTGTLSFKKSHHAKLENIMVMQKEKNILKGRLDLDFGEGTIISGDLAIEPHGTHLLPDIKLEGGKITGTIKSMEFHAQDFARGGGFDTFFSSLAKILGYESFLNNADITLDIPGYQGKVPVKGGHVDMTALPRDVP
ncbi:MAG: hypothetical protein ACT4OY_00605 [Alphaproteobacteria bacterium]